VTRAAARRDRTQQHHLSLTVFRPLPSAKQQLDFFVAPDDWRQRGRVQRLEPAFHSAGAEHLPNAQCFADTLHGGKAHVAVVKQPARKPLRARSNHHCSGPGQCLQPSSEIGRLPDDATLLGFALTSEITDHYYTGSNSDPYSQAFVGNGIEFADGLHHRQPGTYSSLGIVLVRLGITKIGGFVALAMLQ
jgi:hypothetical protein